MTGGKWAAAALALVVAATTSSVAQRGAPQGPGAPRMGPGGMGGGRVPRMRMRMRMTAAMVPVETLASELKLSKDQKDRIAKIQEAQRAAMRKALETMGGGMRMGGPPGGPRAGGPTAPRGPGGATPGAPGRARPGGPAGTMPGGPGAGMFGAIREQMEKADGEIQAVLTADQKKKLPGVLQSLGYLRWAGIPMQVLPKLKLSSSQRNRIEAAAKKAVDSARALPDDQRRAKVREMRDQLEKQTRSILTAEQRKTLDAEAARVRGFLGGPGGPGGPGMFRPGGAPRPR